MSEKIEVDQDEVKQLFLFLEELNHFFHQPMKYGDQAQVINYVEGGMYDKLKVMYYDVVWNWFPPAIQEEFINRPSPFAEPNIKES